MEEKEKFMINRHVSVDDDIYFDIVNQEEGSYIGSSIDQIYLDGGSDSTIYGEECGFLSREEAEKRVEELESRVGFQVLTEILEKFPPNRKSFTGKETLCEIAQEAVSNTISQLSKLAELKVSYDEPFSKFVRNNTYFLIHLGVSEDSVKILKTLF